MFRDNKPIHLSPYDHPDIYPGPRPVSSFLFSNGVAHRIEEGAPSVEDSIIHLSSSDHMYGSFIYPSHTKITVRDYLEANQLTPMIDRIPVLAYGSNVCLAQLLYKSSINKNVSDLFLCMRATIIDTDVVYGALLAPYGALPAIIAPVKDARTEVWVTFLDKDQLEQMHQTEGGYEFRVHKGNKIELFANESITNVYAYYYPRALFFHDSYYRFPDIPGVSSLPSMWQADMINECKMLCEFEGTREGFIHLVRWDHSFRLKVKQRLSKFESILEHPDWEIANDVYTMKELRKQNEKPPSL
ncbi:hypothetical protein ACFSCX_21655 [Bacillus salitolerans]|uniref:Uncharacterized protein n=1 Tax=Bacillus salitolerans TaxID=1437434 RepID=A0ABW4LYC5_9BACI